MTSTHTFLSIEAAKSGWRETAADTHLGLHVEFQRGNVLIGIAFAPSVATVLAAERTITTKVGDQATYTTVQNLGLKDSAKREQIHGWLTEDPEVADPKDPSARTARLREIAAELTASAGIDPRATEPAPVLCVHCGSPIEHVPLIGWHTPGATKDTCKRVPKLGWDSKHRPVRDGWARHVRDAAAALIAELDTVPGNVAHYAVEGARMPVRILWVQMGQWIERAAARDAARAAAARDATPTDREEAP
jgi:hypothetical protein